MNGKSWIVVMLIDILPPPPPEQTKLHLQAHETEPKWPCPWDNVVPAVTVIYEEIRCHMEKRLNCASDLSAGVLGVGVAVAPGPPLTVRSTLSLAFVCVYRDYSSEVQPGIEDSLPWDGAREPSAWSKTGT